MGTVRPKPEADLTLPISSAGPENNMEFETVGTLCRSQIDALKRSPSCQRMPVGLKTDMFRVPILSCLSQQIVQPPRNVPDANLIFRLNIDNPQRRCLVSL